MLDSPPCRVLEYAGVLLSESSRIAPLERCWHLQDASAAFAESIADLAPAELLHMGMDTSGSRSLEAFLGSAASAKVKKRVVRKLAGSYAKLGSSPGGSHVAQACYRTAVSLFASMAYEPSSPAAMYNGRPWAPCVDAACQTLYNPISGLCTDFYNIQGVL